MKPNELDKILSARHALEDSMTKTKDECNVFIDIQGKSGFDEKMKVLEGIYASINFALDNMWYDYGELPLDDCKTYFITTSKARVAVAVCVGDDKSLQLTDGDLDDDEEIIKIKKANLMV